MGEPSVKVVAARGHQPSLASQREEDSRDVSAESCDARKPHRLSCWLVGLSSAPPWRHCQEIRAGGAALSCPRTLRTHRSWAGPPALGLGKGKQSRPGWGVPEARRLLQGGACFGCLPERGGNPSILVTQGPRAPEPALPQHMCRHPGPRGPDPSLCHKGKLRVEGNQASRASSVAFPGNYLHLV